MHWIILTILILASATCGDVQAQPVKKSIDELMSALRQKPDDLQAIAQLAKDGKVDARVIPFLKNMFLSCTRDETPKFPLMRTSQLLALSLFRLGANEQPFFDELAHYMRLALVANPPDPWIYNAEGKEDVNRRNPEFEAWCADRDGDFQACFDRVINYVVSDIGSLVASNDKRSIPLLREALHAKNATFVITAATGLAALNDTASMPLIESACEMLPSTQARLVVVQMSQYLETPEMDRLIDRFVQDPKIRDSVKKFRQTRKAKVH